MPGQFGRPAFVAFAASVLVVTAAAAQPLGTFTWQLQPFCNVVTVNLTQQGAVYTMDGFDDQCGAPQRAALVGLATPNADGSIAVGLNLVTAPGGRGVQVAARFTLPTASGTWSDSAGNAGTFAFGASTGGSPRPAPTVPGSAIALGSISAQHLTPGTIGAGQINPGQVQARVGGTCANGQALRGVNPDGTVICTDALNAADATTGNAGNFSAIAIGADGLPVVSHVDGSAGTVRVTHCGNAACSAGIVSTTVAAGEYDAIAMGVDGLPVVSYRDLTAGGLGVTHCGNATCTAGNVSTVVDAGSSRGYYTAIAIGTDGLPVVSHQDVATGALRVTHCGNVACTAGNVSTTVDDPVNVVGQFTAIAIGADGLPVISHQDATTATLRVTHCGNALCSAGHVSTTVDPNFGVGGASSIAIGADGLPVISHFDSGASRLRVTHCGNAACTAGNVSNGADAPGYVVGSTPSIAIGVDGLPVISHHATTAGALRVTHCGNAACSAGNLSTTVDDPVNSVGRQSAIAIGTDGLPVISYQDTTAGTLRVIKCGTRTCQ